jgi:hypothetical protein
LTIARRRVTPLAALSAPAAATAEPSLRLPPAPLVVPPGLRDVPAPESTAPAGRLRRCTFRRLDRVEPLPGRVARVEYEVMCLYGGDTPLALGDVASAQPVCQACAATGIFRPDEA